MFIDREIFLMEQMTFGLLEEAKLRLLQHKVAC